MPCPTWLPLVLVLASAAVAGPVRAGSPGDDADLRAAKDEFDAAQTLYIQGQFEAAALKFVAAYERKPFPAFLFNAAVTYERAGKLDLARQHLEKYLEKDPGAKDAADVRQRIKSIEAAMAASAGAPGPTLPKMETKGLVVVDSKPPGARVYLGDRSKGPVGHTPWQGSVEPRPTKLIIEAKGFKTEEREISPRPDRIVDIYFALSEEHFLGWVEISSNVVGASIYLDRTDIGALGHTPFTGHLQPGKHVVYLDHPAYVRVRREIEVLPGTATPHRIQMEAVSHGWISIAGREVQGGRLLVDGSFACKTPCRQEVPPGRHAVVVEREEMESFRAPVEVERAQETRVSVGLQPKTSRFGDFVVLGIAAAIGGTGGYLGYLAVQNRDGFKRDFSNGEMVESNDRRLDTGWKQAVTADALMGVGALLGVLAVIGILQSGPPSTGSVERSTPTFQAGVGPGSPGGGGVEATWRF